MSWLTVLLRDIVEPAALAILQWAWSFDAVDAPPALTLPFRFYAYSSTSVLLWLYELLPHWLLLTFLLLGVFFVLLIAIFISCYPLRFAYRGLALATKLSLLLFRCTLVGVVRGGYWLYSRRHSVPRLGWRRPYRPRFEVHLPPAPVRPAVIDRATAALGPPPPLRAFPAVALDHAPALGPDNPPRSSRRRQPRSLRR